MNANFNLLIESVQFKEYFQEMIPKGPAKVF